MRLPDDVFERVVEEAVRQERSRNKIIIRALREFFELSDPVPKRRMKIRPESRRQESK